MPKLKSRLYGLIRMPADLKSLRTGSSIFFDINYWFLLIFLALSFFLVSCTSEAEEASVIAIAIHGGAGTILKKNMTPEKEAAYKAKLDEALQAGYKVLQSGGSSLDAIEAAIMIMEDSPLFNAGKGAVFTNAGSNELDASIMDGKTRQAGAVAGVSGIKNPIGLARLVMEKSVHVMLSGEGAETFAARHGIEAVEADYFHTPRRWEQLQKRLEAEKSPSATGQQQLDKLSEDYKFGTVGAVALDRRGNLAAGTSTGGMINKRYGRIGDSPIIGAGTYADNATCAVSSTGHGEFFIRSVVAYDIAAMMQYNGVTLQQAAEEVVNNKLKAFGGSGGVIALDADGNIAMPFNTAGMYRASIDKNGQKTIKIYKD